MEERKSNCYKIMSLLEKIFVYNDIVLYGEKVVAYSLKQENVESYLPIYKRTSTFSEIYEQMLEFWEETYQFTKNEIFGEKGSKERYLISEKDFSQGYCDGVSYD